MPEHENGELFPEMDDTKQKKAEGSAGTDPQAENEEPKEIGEPRMNENGSEVEKNVDIFDSPHTPTERTRASAGEVAALDDAESGGAGRPATTADEDSASGDVDMCGGDAHKSGETNAEDHADDGAAGAGTDESAETDTEKTLDEDGGDERPESGEAEPTARMPTVIATLDVNLEALIRSPYNARLQSNSKDIEALASGLRNGLVPLVFVRRRADGTYEILEGHRIVEAWRYLGRTTVQVVVLDIPDDLDAAMYVIGTDRKIAPLCAWELMRAIAMLVLMAEGRMSQKEIGDRNGLRGPEVSEAKTANEALSADVMARAGISEQTHSRQLQTLRRRHMRYIVDGPNGKRAAEGAWAPEDVADRLREVVLGDARELGSTAELDQISDKTTGEGDWTLTIPKMTGLSKVEFDVVIRHVTQLARRAWKAANAGPSAD